MSLIRYDGATLRTPSPEIWRGLPDWVAGSNAAYLGQRDFCDFAPFLGVAEATPGADPLPTGGTVVVSTTGSPAVALQTDRFGIINVTEAAGTDECISLQREIWYDLNTADLIAVGAYVEQIADADSPIAFVGLFDGTLAFASGVLDGGSNEDTLGIRWNADETFDIVGVDSGTITVHKTGIGPTVARTDGLCKIEMRIEKVTSTMVRLTPAINGVIYRAAATNVLLTSLPENPMRPCVAQTVSATTAPSFDLDWIASGDK